MEPPPAMVRDFGQEFSLRIVDSIAVFVVVDGDVRWCRGASCKVETRLAECQGGLVLIRDSG